MGLMNNIVGGLNKIADAADKNSPAILTFMGITGMISTVVIACKATPKACQIVDDAKADAEFNDILLENGEINEEVHKADNKSLYLETGKKLAITYLPAVGMGVISIACIIGSYNINNKRVAALATAYRITDTAYNEYRDKVVDILGEKKDKKVRESIAQDKLDKNPVEQCVVYETGRGNTLIFEPMTARYYHGNIDDMYKAESTINKRLFGEMYSVLNDFFDEMGFNEQAPRAILADQTGFNPEHMMDMDKHTGVATNGEPCFVLDYLTEPSPDYI